MPLKPAVLPLSLLLGACGPQIPTLREYAESAIGRDIAVVQAVVRQPGSYASSVGWQERTYPLPNGHWVYVEPDRPGCEIHYEVDGGNVVVGYTPMGSGCAHQ
jgi:hypothetical protein